MNSRPSLGPLDHEESIIALRKRPLTVPGLRFSCCKSGKDRTGMAVTLEQAQILSSEFDLAEHEYQRALDVMRRSVELFHSCGLHM